MNYIIAEQFLELPRKVQKIFIDWWEIKEGDTIYSVDEDKEYTVARVDEEFRGEGDYWYYDYDADELMLFSKSPDEGEYTEIPLFRIDQLIKFIQTKYKHIGVNNFIPFKKITETTRITSDKGIYEWNIKIFKSMNQFEPDIEILNEDLLQAFWKVAVIVAGDIGGMNNV